LPLISTQCVRDYIERGIEAGLIFENRAYSTYYLTFLGLDVLQKKGPLFERAFIGKKPKL